ncbi:N-6 DNA methylase, partial [Streptococcus suis]
NKNTTDTLFIDASREFKKETNNNILTEDNIQNILDGFDKGEDKEYFVSVASHEKIVENDYNLSVSTYVEKEDTREKIDIVQLNKDIAETVKNIDRLRAEIDKIVEELSHDQ